MRIALVEDDEIQAQQLIGWLKEESCNVHWYSDGQSFIQMMQRESFDMVILDWNLPDTTGLDLMRKIREIETQTVVIFITSRSSESDIVTALRQGADDYLVKPISQAETRARITSILRRMRGKMEDEGQEHYPPFTLHHDYFTVTFDDNTVQLTPKEYELACFMFQNRGRLLSRNHILECVWGLSSDLTTRTVDMHISKVRRKLGLKPDRGWRLISVYQYGYRLESLADSDNK